MMKLGVFFVLSFGCGPAVAGICPPDWPLFGRKCYYALKQNYTWADSRTACEELEAHLAVPSSISENSFIWDLFVETFDRSPPFGAWAGYSFLEKDGKWQPNQRDGEPYANWGINQPRNNTASCAVMSIGSKGKWGSQLCANPRGVVCERTPSSAPQVFCFHTDGNGRLTTPRCLKHHVVSELPVDGVVSCGKACRAEHRCRSFNLLKQGGGVMACQLNNATRHEVPEEAIMEDSKNCYHFDL